MNSYIQKSRDILTWGALLFLVLLVPIDATAIELGEPTLLDTATPCRLDSTPGPYDTCWDWTEFGDGTLHKLKVCLPNGQCFRLTATRVPDGNGGWYYRRFIIGYGPFGGSIWLECDDQGNCKVTLSSTLLLRDIVHESCKIETLEEGGMQLYCPTFESIEVCEETTDDEGNTIKECREEIIVHPFYLILSFPDQDRDGTPDEICITFENLVYECFSTPAGFPTVYPNLPGYEDKDPEFDIDNPTPGRGIPPILE